MHTGCTRDSPVCIRCASGVPPVYTLWKPLRRGAGLPLVCGQPRPDALAGWSPLLQSIGNPDDTVETLGVGERVPGAGGIVSGHYGVSEV